jgi:hypothetical protein
MAFHFLGMSASQTDRPVASITDREDQTIGQTVDRPVGAIARFAIRKTIVGDDRQNIEIDPSCQRYAVLG